MWGRRKNGVSKGDRRIATMSGVEERMVTGG
jgi:hypothetical protein